MDRAGRLARRGRHPRRGRPPGAAARSDLRAGARLRARRWCVERVRDPSPRGPRRPRSPSCWPRPPSAGGHIVLTGGSTPQARLRARRRARTPTGAARRCGSATSAACRPTTRTRTSGWRTRRCSAACSTSRPRVDAHGGRARRRGRRRRLRGAACASSSATTPRCDLLLLGLGPDAHTRVAVPRQAGARGAPAARRRRAERPAWSRRCRAITLTLPASSTAPREVVFLVTGDDKADAVARAFGDPPDPAAPGGHVRPAPASSLVVFARRRPRRRRRCDGATSSSASTSAARRSPSPSLEDGELAESRDLHDRARAPGRARRAARVGDRARCAPTTPRGRRSACRRSSSSPPAGSLTASTSRSHDVPLRELLTERIGHAGLRRERRVAARRSPRRSTTTASSTCPHLVMFTSAPASAAAGAQRAALPRRDRARRPRSGTRSSGSTSRTARRGPRASSRSPARSRRSPPGRALDRLADARPREDANSLPRPAAARRTARSTGHDVVDGRQGGRRRRAARASRPRRAARDRHRQRDQHVRPAGGRDRRRRLDGRATCCSTRPSGSATAYTVPGLGRHTTIRLARHGPQAGVLGAALIAAQEEEAK